VGSAENEPVMNGVDAGSAGQIPKQHYLVRLKPVRSKDTIRPQ
jgi:hypothetical protein